MRLPAALLATAAVFPLLAWTKNTTSTCAAQPTGSIAGDGPAVLPNGKYVITSEGITAYFIPYGASVSNIFIEDVHGKVRDIVLGFDNATYYSQSRLHPHLNGVPGRYANRIRNGTFTIDGTTYHTNLNDNGGLDTLHGGSDGWDYRNWTVTAHTTSSITFSLVDPDGSLGMGFPGEVLAFITYSLTPYQWHISMTALATTKKTPIMLSSHTYWNLDGFQDPKTDLALNHTLCLPYAGLRTEIDGIEIPTGNLLGNQAGGVHDWWSCGFDCTGYDTCYIQSRRDALGPSNWQQAPIATLGSPFSGIQIDVYPDQDAFQLYTCNNMNGTLALKQTQGFFGDASRPRVTRKFGCVVMEVEDWIDGINHPEWGRKQIYGPGDGPYVLEATYRFSVNKTLAAEHGVGNATAYRWETDGALKVS